MKFLLALVAFVLFVNHGINADQALVNKLKPYEKYSPYEWTKWLELRPPQGRQPVAAAAVAYAPYGYEQAARPPPSSDEELDSAEEDEDEYGDSLNPFDQWFKRAILPAAPVPVKKPKKSKDKDATATKKPSIVDVPLDFWGPPASVAPNVTLPPPPGYWAAKKSMFVSKLFAALAASVLNSTGPPALAVDLTTTTVSPRQAILDEIESVLLSDVARSVTTEESEEESEEDDDSKEAQQAPEATTVNPFLLTKQDFLEKLTNAILAQPQAAAPVAPAAPKPTKPAPTPASKKPAKGGKAAAGKKGKADKKATKAPKYLKYIPTTTTTEPPPTIDYDALAKALLGGNSK